MNAAATFPCNASLFACAAKTLRKRSTTIAPSFVAVAILVAVVVATGPSTIAARLSAAHLLAAAPFAFALAFAYTPLQSFWDRRLFARTPRPPSYASVLAGKAAASTLSAVGPLAGTGGYAVWIARATNVGAPTAAALALTISLADLGALGLVAALTAQLGGAHVPTPALAFAIGAIVVVAFATFVARLTSTTKLSALGALSLRELVLQVCGRAIAVTIAVVLTALGARAFGIPIPLDAALELMPLLLFVAALPVNVAGFGAAQAAWALLLQPWAAPADVVAFHLAWSLALNVAYVARGLPFLRRAMRDAATTTT